MYYSGIMPQWHTIYTGIWHEEGAMMKVAIHTGPISNIICIAMHNNTVPLPHIIICMHTCMCSYIVLQNTSQFSPGQLQYPGPGHTRRQSTQSWSARPCDSPAPQHSHQPSTGNNTALQRNLRQLGWKWDTFNWLFEKACQNKGGTCRGLGSSLSCNWRGTKVLSISRCANSIERSHIPHVTSLASFLWPRPFPRAPPFLLSNWAGPFAVTSPHTSSRSFSETQATPPATVRDTDKPHSALELGVLDL